MNVAQLVKPKLFEIRKRSSITISEIRLKSAKSILIHIDDISSIEMNETFIQNQWPWPTSSSSAKRNEINE